MDVTESKLGKRKNFWRNRYDDNIIVTGGAGFIGSNFIFHMLNKYPDYRISLSGLPDLCRTIYRLWSRLWTIRNFRFVKESITDRDAVYRLFEEEKPDIVVNFAAESHVDRSIENPEIFLDTNIKGTAVLMDACRKYGIKRYHQVSTDECMAICRLTDRICFSPRRRRFTPAVHTVLHKAGADLLVLAYHRTYGLPVTISRCSNNYGPLIFRKNLFRL